jgi:hypothetical protein
MRKKAVIAGSIAAVVLLVLCSLSNVVGYQTSQSSNQDTTNNEVNQRELLFQTIVDIANNKEIQRIILESQISREGFFHTDVRTSLFNTPVLTKNQLKHMYVIGLLLSKTISKSKIYSITNQNQLINPETFKQITMVIEKDTVINQELTQLLKFKCDCGDASKIYWPFPLICSTSFVLFSFSLILLFFSRVIGGYESILSHIAFNLECISLFLGLLFNCLWAYVILGPYIPD